MFGSFTTSTLRQKDDVSGEDYDSPTPATSNTNFGFNP